MTDLTIGDRTYKIAAAARDGAWLAHAERGDTGARFGIECAGATEADAIAGMARWLEWQHQHEAALAALQQAEHAYHRTIAGSAFANPTEGPTALEIQKASLSAVEAARVRLDEVRAKKPE